MSVIAVENNAEEPSKILNVALMDIKTGDIRKSFLENNKIPREAYFSKRGRFVAIAIPGDKHISFLDLVRNEQREIALPKPVETLAFAESPEGDLLVVSLSKETLLVETSSARIVDQHDLGDIYFTPDHVITVLPAMEGIRIWHRKSGDISLQSIHGSEFEFSPDGKYLVYLKCDAGIKDGKRELVLVDFPGLEAQTILGRYREHEYSVPWLSNGEVAVFAGGNLAFFDLRDRKRARVFANMTACPFFSPDGRVLVLHDAFVTAYDARLGSVLWKKPSRNEVCFSWDSTSVILYSRVDGNGELVDAWTGELRARLLGHPRSARGLGVSFSLSSKHLLTASVFHSENSWLKRNLRKTAHFAWFDSEEELNSTTEVTAVDMVSGQILARLEIDGDSSLPIISKDRRSLIISAPLSQGSKFQCWDVPPCKPWGAIIGVPIGLGLAGIVLVFAFGRLKVALKKLWRREHERC